MKLYTNIKPHLPEGTEFSWKRMEELNNEGLSINIDLSEQLTTGFNEGQSYLLESYEKVIPPLWVLAHAYINSEKAKNFLDKGLITTSSNREITGSDVYIYHNYEDYYGYGIKVPLKLEDYPEEDLPLETLVNKYPKTAKALFLMNNEQLNKLLLKIPKIPYDLEKPAIQGAGFIDSREIKGAKPYLFGFRREGFAGNVNEFFGITTIEYVPIVSYPIKYGRKNEIEVTYSPEQFYELSKSFEKLKRSLPKKNISETIRKKTESKIKSLEEALFKPLEFLIF